MAGLDKLSKMLDEFDTVYNLRKTNLYTDLMTSKNLA